MIPGRPRIQVPGLQLVWARVELMLGELHDYHWLDVRHNKTSGASVGNNSPERCNEGLETNFHYHSL